MNIHPFAMPDDEDDDPATMSLQRAKDKVMKARDGKGMRCLICDKQVKTNPVALGRYSLGKALMWFYHRTRQTWEQDIEPYIDVRKGAVPHWLDAQRCFHQLQPWNLVGMYKRGFWFITDDGIDFARNESTLQAVAWVYNNKVQKFSGPNICILDCVAQFHEDMLLARFDERDDDERFNDPRILLQEKRKRK